VHAALQQPGIAQLEAVKNRTDPDSWLSAQLEVTNPLDTELLQIALIPSSGVSPQEQATLVNAVVKAYMDEIVLDEAKRRNNRAEMLKKFSRDYAQMIKSRRETMRRLSAKRSVSDLEAAQGREAALRISVELRSRQVALRIEQAGLEALLARRKKGEGETAERSRQEIRQLEDQLAVIAAQQEIIEGELVRLTKSTHEAAEMALDSQEINEDIQQTERAANAINAELERLNVEQQAPQRITVLEHAVAPEPFNK
jgi:hypothetical protein